MMTVPLHGKKAAGRVALVDDTDYDLVMQYRWCVKEQARRRIGGTTTYAVANVKPDGRHTTLLMHKLITGWPQTDHADRDGLNNQRLNLRPASDSENMANRPGLPDTSSRFKGVSWFQGAWVASAGIRGHKVYLGRFADETAAARAYDTAARAAWGEYARVNFPDLPDVLRQRPPCAVCGGQIPETRTARARYCSDACRTKEKTRAWTEARRRRRFSAP